MPQDVNRASRPFFHLQSRSLHPWAAIGTQPGDCMVSMAKYQPALDAREIKRFLDARAKGITFYLTGALQATATVGRTSSSPPAQPRSEA